MTAVFGGVSPMLPADARLFLSIYDAHGGGLRSVAVALSAVGSGWVMLGLVPLFAVRRLRPLAVATTGVLGASALLVFLLKGAVGRARPFVTLPDVHPLVAAPSDPSFPSGHACGSFTFAAFALLLLFRVRAPSVSTPVRAAWGLVLPALAVGVAWSRVYLGVHYPLDVAAGSLLGVCSGAVGASWYLRRAAAGPR